MLLRLNQKVWATCVTVACRRIEGSRTLTYGSDAIKFMWSYLESYQADVVLALCAAELLIFIIILILIMRVRRLSGQIDELSGAVKRVINDEAARYTRSILGRSKDTDAR